MMNKILHLKSSAITFSVVLILFIIPARSQDLGPGVPGMQHLDGIEQSIEKNMTSEKDILGLSWAWQYTRSADDHRVTPKKVGDYTLLLDQNNAVSLKVDCNRARGTYKLEGNRLQFDIGIMTRAMCPDPEMDNSFVSDINKIENYSIENGLLILTLKNKEGVMFFEPVSDSGGETTQ
jgi:heat shock protein HslJ